MAGLNFPLLHGGDLRNLVAMLIQQAHVEQDASESSEV